MSRNTTNRSSCYAVGLVAWMLVSFVGTAGQAQTVIEGGEVRPVSGEPIESGRVVIGDNGKIRAVGGPELEVPDDAEVVDADDGVVTPGFVDARTRLGVVEVWAVGQTRDFNRGGGDRIRAAFRAADGFDPTSTAITVARNGGVTSSVVVPGGGLVSGRSAWVDLIGGEHARGRVVDPEAGMHVRLGPRAGGGDWESGLRARGALFELLRELYADLDYFRDHRQDFDQNRMRDVRASRADLVALEPTVAGEVPTVFEVHRSDQIERVVEFGEQRGLTPVISGGVEAWTVADELAEQNVPVVVKPTANLPTGFDTLGARTDNAALLADAGVPVVLSTFGVHKLARLRQMAGNAVRAGMSRSEALEAITLTPARVFGRGDAYGSLEKGKFGNVAVWSGDPFELSSDVEALFVRGERVSLEGRQQKLFERYRTLDRRGPPAPPDDGGGRTQTTNDEAD